MNLKRTRLNQSESVNEKLLRQGWAWVQEAYCEKAVLCGQLNDVQAEAERSMPGIWAKIPEDVPPWRCVTFFPDQSDLPRSAAGLTPESLVMRKK